MNKKQQMQLHGPCAGLLMKEYGVPGSFKKEVVELINQIYHSERMAHSLIILSIRGLRVVSQTRSLQYFLQGHGTKNPQQHREEMMQRQEEEF